MAEHYIVFDANCPTCCRLAQLIKQVAGSQLNLINIHTEETKSLLDKAFPNGWVHNPYLIQINSGKIRAWTHLNATIRLIWLLGIRKSFLILRRGQQAGLKVIPRWH